MSNHSYIEEFKIEPVKQVTEKGKPDADVTERLSIFTTRDVAQRGCLCPRCWRRRRGDPVAEISLT